jgi:hypothetical protein
MKSGAKYKRVSRINVSQIEGYPDVPRGHALVGARAIAEYIWNDPEKITGSLFAAPLNVRPHDACGQANRLLRMDRSSSHATGEA